MPTFLNEFLGGPVGLRGRGRWREVHRRLGPLATAESGLQDVLWVEDRGASRLLGFTTFGSSRKLGGRGSGLPGTCTTVSGVHISAASTQNDAFTKGWEEGNKGNRYIDFQEG